VALWPESDRDRKKYCQQSYISNTPLTTKIIATLYFVSLFTLERGFIDL
jgi:hypothetical protein